VQPSVDLVVNSFEGTYRKVLSPGFFRQIEAQHQRSFERVVALINNVEDRREAGARAEKLLELGEIDAYYWVADYLEKALTKVGLMRRDLGRVPHYTDFLLVAVTLPGNPYLLHWDAEVCLRQSRNWIDPALELMERDQRVFVANPNWRQPTLEKETLWKAGDFAFGYGFSDQLFLVRRSEVSRPIYKSHCLASFRYPVAHVAAIFEQRVDAYMRTHGRLRATYTRATYEHPESEGASHPAASPIERARLIRNRAIVRILRRLPTTDPCWRV
jgi:hypothetical protein